MQAASGIGEPFVSAIGILGVMAVWRTFYVGFLDFSYFLTYDSARSRQPEDQGQAWVETVTVVLALTCAAAVAAAALHFAGQRQV
jgi:hypothetical protein